MKKILFILLILCCSCSRSFDESLNILVIKNESSSKEELWLMDTNGANETQLTSYSSENRCSSGSWSQDGSKIVYLQFNSGKFSNLMVMDSDGKNKRLIASNPNGYYSPSFFIDNMRIAVSENTLADPYLFYIINIYTGEIKTLSTNAFTISQLSVSAYNTIMITEPSMDGGYQLWNESTGLSPVTTPPGALTLASFSWNSSGNLIAAYDSGLSEIYLLNPATQTKTTVIASLTADTTVSWDPSNEYIYFSTPSGIIKIKPDGTGIQIVSLNSLYSQPQVQYKTK